MKTNIILLMLIGLCSLSSKAQDLNCVNVLTSFDDGSLNMRIIFSGKDAKDLDRVDVRHNIRTSDGRIISRIPFASSASNEGGGHVWTASLDLGGFVREGDSYNTTAIISVPTPTGGVKQWEVQYAFGSGTKNATTMTSTKPRLL